MFLNKPHLKNEKNCNSLIDFSSYGFLSAKDFILYNWDKLTYEQKIDLREVGIFPISNKKNDHFESDGGGKKKKIETILEEW